MDRGESEEVPEYPRAPLPAHERHWRHPSEIGASNWTRTEPPLAVGKGLSIATGTIGAVLALGLLWLMVPHGSGGGVAVEQSTPSIRTTPQPSAVGREVVPPASLAAQAISPASATTLTAVSAPTSTTKTDVRVDVPTTSAPRNSLATTTVATTASTGGAETPSTIGSTSPVPTLLIEQADVSSRLPAIAVALTTGHYVVTTAAAVEGRSKLSVQLPSGEAVEGSVVSVDPSSGTAVLFVPMTIQGVSFEPSSVVVSTEGVLVTVPGSTVRIWNDDAGTHVSYEADLALGEGALVIDRDGRLMGMCTRKDTGIHLVSVGSMLTALDGVATSDTSSTAGP